MREDDRRLKVVDCQHCYQSIRVEYVVRPQGLLTQGSPGSRASNDGKVKRLLAAQIRGETQGMCAMFATHEEGRDHREGDASQVYLRSHLIFALSSI